MLDCHRSCRNYYSWSSNNNMTSHGVILAIEIHGGHWDIQHHLRFFLLGRPLNLWPLFQRRIIKQGDQIQPSKYRVWRHNIQKIRSSFCRILATFNVGFWKILLIYKDKSNAWNKNKKRPSFEIISPIAFPKAFFSEFHAYNLFTDTAIFQYLLKDLLKLSHLLPSLKHCSLSFMLTIYSWIQQSSDTF